MKNSVSPGSTLPLVSIITPSYNQAAFLEQTIQSVLLQDYEPTEAEECGWVQPCFRPFRLEYIIVDGASSDGSLEIIQSYSNRLAWWLSEPDRGQAEAINKGLQRARGEIVAWLNSDDIYLPGAITGAVAALEANPSLGMVFGDAITIDARGHPLNRLTFGDWGLAELMAFRIICQPAVFMRRAVLEKAGFLDPAYHFMLDHQLWLRMARLAQIQHIPQVWAAARHHPGAKNVKHASGFSLETQRVLEWILSQPDLAPSPEVPFRERRSATRKYSSANIYAGAYRLQARYFLDGDQPAAALRFYARALLYSPGYALKHWHRMLYATLCLVGARHMADHAYHWWIGRREEQMAITGMQGLSGWPGLLLEETS